MSLTVKPAPPARAVGVEMIQGGAHVRVSRMGERKGKECVKFDLSAYSSDDHAWGSIEISLDALPMLRRAIEVIEGK